VVGGDFSESEATVALARSTSLETSASALGAGAEAGGTVEARVGVVVLLSPPLPSLPRETWRVKPGRVLKEEDLEGREGE
jgi:hypothetical protein